MNEEHFCKCKCHRGVAKEHQTPCCDGPCKRCKAIIRTGMMSAHILEAHPDTKPPSKVSGSFKRPLR